jgi:hypothetical protein
LLFLLKQTLKFKGLALMPLPDREGEPVKWFQVTKVEDAIPQAPIGEAKDFQNGDLFTEVFQLKYLTLPTLKPNLLSEVKFASAAKTRGCEVRGRFGRVVGKHL